MRGKLLGFILILLLTLCLCACTPIGDKTTSISVIYAATFFLSIVTLVGYTLAIKKKEVWFYVLLVSVLTVNFGYLWLSNADTLASALWSNRLSYLGSVFLPISMIMIILKVSRNEYKKWLPYILTGAAIVIFFIAATPGYLDIYYKEVVLKSINGVSVLEKSYGSWHKIYLFYLFICFGFMLASIIRAIAKKKIETASLSIVLIMSVFVNICVWLLEQLVKINFEFLSVSYIITEIFLICAYLLLQNQEKLIASLQAKIPTVMPPGTVTVDKTSPEFISHCKFIKEQLPHLTPTERAVYNCYLEGKSTKEILVEMAITENTLKFHNKNLYSKLGVSSRRQLSEYAKEIEKGAV